MILLDIEPFLNKYRGMKLQPISSDSHYELEGKFKFTAKSGISKEISDTYNLKIEIPKDFPKNLIKVYSIDNKIERKDENHVNRAGDFCLGSELRLKKIAIKLNDFNKFIEKVLIPFLYSHSLKRINGGKLIFGELSHGVPGLIEDYINLFHVKSKEELLMILKLLSLKKRVANKLLCPLGCGKKVGRCRCNYKKEINFFRKVKSRNHFKLLIKLINSEGDMNAI